MSRGIDGFQPERLIQVLAARRLNQTQLSAMVGVSPATISKWRSGQQAPEAEALEKLATVVNVMPEWFTRPMLPEISKPLFRSNASAHVAARAMMAARLAWADSLVHGMSSFVDFPTLNLPEFDFCNIDEISTSDIEIAANQCRKLWGLGMGAMPNLALATESNGIILVREETGVAQIEGVSTWSKSIGRPIILLSSDKDNAFRSRFDLAHELGHLILHRHINVSLESERYKLMENQAHQFAGALLLPAETFADEVRTPVTLDSLLLLKQRYGISVAAIIMRLHVLGIISDEDKQLLYKRRSARWGVKSEPGDDSREPEKPCLIKRTIELLVTSGIMPIDSIARYSGLSAIDVEMLAGLPCGYLTGQKAEVVQLATLKSVSQKKEKNNTNTSSVIEFTHRPNRFNS